MIYPTISEYIESIKLAEDNFATLTQLRPVIDGGGNPVMSSGNFAVVFKMQDIKTEKHYALKCFIKDQPERAESYRLIADELEYVSSDYIVSVRYLEKELFVDSTAGSGTEFPVLLMDWVEGTTLDKWVKQHLGSQHALQLIIYKFCRMASWLMSQPFAHGDLKPDNIIVRGDGSLVLVDYDGMYVPAMQGQKARELGSPDYRHPARTADDFNEHIDDFALAAIAMQLAAIAHDPGLFDNQNGDTLLLTEADHRDPAGSTNHQRLHSLLGKADFERLYALYHLAHAQQTLSNVSFRAFQFPKPEKKPEPIELSTEVNDEDIKYGVKDEFGALYSPDGLRLLAGPHNEHYYQIRQGTRIICDEAFGYFDMFSLTIPDSVTHIGESAFSFCVYLCSITIPDSVTHIGDYAFNQCESLSSITIPDSVTHIGKYAFNQCESLTSITIPDSVTHIGDGAFEECKSLSSIAIPDSVTHIGANPFVGSGICRIECDSPFLEADEHALYTKGKRAIISFFGKSISRFTIPNSVTHIEKYAFMENDSLTSITIPDSVTHIGDGAFRGCKSLSSLTIPYSVVHIGDGAFWFCVSLSYITIPDFETHIGESAFLGCESLSSITIPKSVTHIGANPFANSGVCRIECKSPFFEADEHALYTKGKRVLISFFGKSTSRFTIPDSVTHIGDGAFRGCKSLSSLTIPYSVVHIGDGAFSRCLNLTSLTIPDSVTHIGESAFSFCVYLCSITIPDSVTHIGNSVFFNSNILSSIIIPRGSRAKFERMLPEYLHNKLKEQ